MSRRVFRTAEMMVAGITAVLASAGQLPATVDTWTGTTSADWSVSGNWTNGIPNSSDQRITFDPGQYGSQLSPVNDLSSASLRSVWLGNSTTNNGGFDVTGNSISLVGYTNGSSPLVGFTDYGNNTWGLDTSLGGPMNFYSYTPAPR